MNNFQPVNPYPYSHSIEARVELVKQSDELATRLENITFNDFINDNELASKVYEFIRSVGTNSDIANSAFSPLYPIMEAVKDMFARSKDYITPYIDSGSKDEVFGKVDELGYFPGITLHLPHEIQGKELSPDAMERLELTLQNFTQWMTQLQALDATKDIGFYSLRLVQSYNYSPSIAYIHFNNENRSYAMFAKGNMFAGGIILRGTGGQFVQELLDGSGYEKNPRAFAIPSKAK